MAEVYTSRTKTYSSGDQVESADLNAIQDGIIACSEAIGDVAELDSGDLVADLTGRSGVISILPWGEGEPILGVGANNLYQAGADPNYVQVDNVGGGTWWYAVEKHLGQMVIEKFTKLRLYFARSAAAAVLSLKLVEEVKATGARTVLQTLTASSTAGTWTSEATSTFDETYDRETNFYYLELVITPDAAITEVKLRALEIEYEGKYIGS